MGMTMIHPIVIIITKVVASGETTTVIVVIGDGMKENTKEERDLTTIIVNQQEITVGETTVKPQSGADQEVHTVFGGKDRCRGVIQTKGHFTVVAETIDQGGP